MTRRGDPPHQRRSIVYCLVPADLAAKLHEPLRQHFRDDPGVEVVVERRRADRRRAPDRRTGQTAPQPATERRTIRATEGRRVGRRRAATVPVEPPCPLPRKALPHADRLVFVERVEPATEHFEDLDTARLVARFQSGDREVFGTLYMRYFDRVYTYLELVLRDEHEAEDLAQDVFMKVFQNLDRYERRPSHPFRTWLFTIVRNQGVSRLRARSHADVEEPARLERRQETLRRREPSPQPEQVVPDWITDRDLQLFVERLPDSQRQVLLLRYLLGLTSTETAEILGYTPNQVRKLQQRAMEFLRARLAAVGRAPRRQDRPIRVRVRPSQAFVVRSRRFTLR